MSSTLSDSTPVRRYSIAIGASMVSNGSFFKEQYYSTAEEEEDEEEQENDDDEHYENEQQQLDSEYWLDCKDNGEVEKQPNAFGAMLVGSKVENGDFDLMMLTSKDDDHYGNGDDLFCHVDNWLHESFHLVEEEFDDLL